MTTRHCCQLRSSNHSCTRTSSIRGDQILVKYRRFDGDLTVDDARRKELQGLLDAEAYVLNLPFQHDLKKATTANIDEWGYSQGLPPASFLPFELRSRTSMMELVGAGAFGTFTSYGAPPNPLPKVDEHTAILLTSVQVMDGDKQLGTAFALVRVHIFQQQIRWPILDAIKFLEARVAAREYAYGIFVHTDEGTRAGPWPVSMTTTCAIPILAYFVTDDGCIAVGLAPDMAPAVTLNRLCTQEMNVNSEMKAVIPFDTWWGSTESAKPTIEETRLSILKNMEAEYTNYHADPFENLGSKGYACKVIGLLDQATPVVTVDINDYISLDSRSYSVGLKDGLSADALVARPLPPGVDRDPDRVSQHEANLLLEGYKAKMQYEHALSLIKTEDLQFAYVLMGTLETCNKAVIDLLRGVLDNRGNASYEEVNRRLCDVEDPRQD